MTEINAYESMKDAIALRISHMATGELKRNGVMKEDWPAVIASAASIFLESNGVIEEQRWVTTDKLDLVDEKFESRVKAESELKAEMENLGMIPDVAKNSLNLPTELRAVFDPEKSGEVLDKLSPFPPSSDK